MISLGAMKSGMSEPRRIGVIGCGQQAPKHIGGLSQAAGAGRIEIVAADVMDGAAEALAGRIDGVMPAASVDAVFDDPKVDGIVLCTPTPSHAALIRQAIAAGKDFLVEKPLCEDYTEAKALEAETTATGRIGMVGYIYRYAPPFEQAAAALAGARETGEAAALGRVTAATLRVGGRGSRQPWKHLKATGGGAINEMLVHMLDLAIWYFGPPAEAELLTSKLLRPERLIQGEMHKVDAEDYVVVRLASAAGVEIMIQADLITPAFAQSLEAQGENGSLIASVTPNVASKLFVDQPRAGFAQGWTDIGGAADFYVGQSRAFLDAIQSRKQPDRGALGDAVALMQTVEKLRAAL